MSLSNQTFGFSLFIGPHLLSSFSITSSRPGRADYRRCVVGYRLGSGVDFVGVLGYYWSSTAHGESYVYGVGFDSGSVTPNYDDGRNYGCSVRLVTDAK